MNTFIAEINSEGLFEEFHSKSSLDVNKTIWIDPHFKFRCSTLSKPDSAFIQNERFILILDGEISNLHELGSNSPNRIKTANKLEILLRCLTTHSIDVLAPRLNGQFAIVIFDKLEKQIFLVKDIFGSKPLYYGIEENTMVVGTQFDTVFKHPNLEKAALRPEIMKEFLSFGYMHAPNTIFENIFQVEASQIVRWKLNENKLSKSRYYKWNFTEKNLETGKETVNKFDKVLSDVIDSQRGGTSKLFSFLSGGIDSPLITSFLTEKKSKVDSFTFQIDNKQFNEGEIAKKYAEILNVKHQVYQIKSDELLSIINNHFRALSEPLGDYSSIASYFMAMKVREHTDSIFSGDGGDELFWGYPRFLKPLSQAKWFRLPLSVRKIIIPVLRKINPSLSFILQDRKYFHEWIRHQHIHLDTELLMPDISFSKELNSSYVYKGLLKPTPILQYLKKTETENHLQRVLKKIELTSRPFELTVKSPFIDKQILEFSNSIVPTLHKHQTSKYILKKTLAKRTEEDLVMLPKKGFSVPITRWLQNELKEDLSKTLLDTSFFGEEYIDKKILHQWVQDFLNGKRTINSWGLWHLYAWQKWFLKL